MYLQLADNKQPAYLGQGEQPLPQELYEYMLAVPTEDGGIVWMREDQLDHLPDEAIYNLMQSQPHMSGVKDWFARSRQRKEARRTGRQTARGERQAGRQQFISGLVGKVGDIFGGPEGQDPSRGVQDWFPQVTGGASIGVAKWWQNPMVIGAAVLGTLGIIYVVTKKK